MKSLHKGQAPWRAVLGYIGAYWPLLALSLVLSAAGVAAALYIPVLIGDAIDAIGSGAAVADIVSPLVTAAIIACAGGAVQWLIGIINNRVCYNVVRNARLDAFKCMQSVPLSYIDSRDTGDIVSRITSDAEQLGDGLLLGATQLFTGVLTIAGTLCFMLALSPVIALAVVVLTPLSLFIARYIAKKTHSMFIEQAKARGEQTAFVEEMLSNRKIVAAFSHETAACADFGRLNKNVEDTSRRAAFFSSLVNPSTRFVNSVVYAAVALIGAVTVINGGITVGLLSCFLSYANQYAKPFNEISGVVTELQNAFACAGRLFELTDAPVQSKCGVLELQGAAGVKFDNVCFSYVPERPLINNFSIDIKKGSRVAIVGPTGCGKTTVINLLMRFYEPQGGKILMDGVPLQEITRASLRRNYGMVLQETWLKHGTVRENIALGRPDATFQQVAAAAELAHADSFISRLPNGYDTVISDDDSISQGEKQLLCIARVALCMPPMLILDEATSSIDTRTEMKIQDAFARMMKGRTSFVVAHRLSTVKNSDMILVMKDGNIIEQGSHEQLIKMGGFYAKLYKS